MSVLAIIILLIPIAVAVYFNEVIFPQKIKSVLIEGFEAATGKKIELSSAKLDLFKGLVVKDLAILDNDLWVVTAKEARLRFLIFPLFKKQIIITSLKLESPRIFVERAKDNSINIVKIFFEKPLLPGDAYNLTISRIILHNSDINFQDKTFDPPLLKDIKNAYLDARISLPDRIVFNTEFGVSTPGLPILIKAAGEYKALKKEWSFNIEAKDLCLKELSPYLKGQDILLPDGRADAQADVHVDSDRLGARINMTSLGLDLAQEPVKANINCSLTVNVEYDLNKKTLIYSGDIDIKNLALSGLEYIGRIDDIRGRAVFTESRFLSKNLTCTLAGLPVKAKANLTDFKRGTLNIDVASSTELKTLKSLLKDRFNMKLPADIFGPCKLNLRLEYKMPITSVPVVNGTLDTPGAKMVLDYNKTLLENVKGVFRFTSNQLSWEDIMFKHMDTDYNSSGRLTNFEKPGIDIELYSKDLSVKSLLAVNGSHLALSRFEGRYGTMEFSSLGDLDTADPANIMAQLSGTVKFDLGEDKEPFKRFKNMMKDSKPSGRLTAKFALKGNLNDLNSCAADVEVSGDRISLYKFKLENFIMNYVQRNGVMDIVKMQASLYGGTLDGSGRIGLTSQDKGYQVKAEVKGLKIEKAKLDTAFKGYDISGSIYSRFGLKGYLDDSSKFSAWGKINISDGKLWQLDLFKGIGALIFRRDFSAVIFKEGDCDFSVKDKVISMNDISLRSGLLNMNGVARIGFDGSIAASLKTEFTDEGLDAGKVANISAAIERYSIIEVNGTLKEPKIEIRPDLSNVAGDIAERLFQQ